MIGNKPSVRLVIELPYSLGIAADALWTVAMFHPALFGALTGDPRFEPDLRVRLIMAMAGSDDRAHRARAESRLHGRGGDATDIMPRP